MPYLLEQKKNAPEVDAYWLIDGPVGDETSERCGQKRQVGAKREGVSPESCDGIGENDAEMAEEGGGVGTATCD